MKYLIRLCAVLPLAAAIASHAQSGPPAYAAPEAQPLPSAGDASAASGGDLPAADPGPVVLDWTPPGLAELSTMAAMKSSFTLDRDLLRLAAGVMPDAEAPTRQAIGKLDGVSVHLLRFGASGAPDEGAVQAMREAYHLRGWKHVMSHSGGGGAIHDNTTDVWMVLDGVNMRGAVILAETPGSLTLVTVKGDLSPIDLLHLRGHFGIPRFDSQDMRSAR